MVARKMVTPGHTTLDIPFNELLIESYGGDPDFSEIQNIVFYLRNPESNVTLYFDNVSLK